MTVRTWTENLLWWVSALALTGVYLYLLTRSDMMPLRPIYTLLYMLLVPGAIWVHCLRIRNVWISMALFAPLSLAIVLLISQLTLYLRVYSLTSNVALLLLVSVSGLLTDIFIASREHRAVKEPKRTADA